ncbi:MAG TPA: PEP-CTERM sorting domain-containing protein [Pirellulales bacterium]|nr:PEP-CTERM sorting domain-containing protein [Pirellulales bacterium]
MLRRIHVVSCLAVFLALQGVSYGDMLELDFASTAGAHLSFNGANGTFSFTPDANGHEFQINNVSGGTGSALNLFGNISGTFTLGAISGDAAPVTGSGVLTVSDGTNDFTADISLSSIAKVGAMGIVNPTEVVNLSNFHYSGSNADLSAFSSAVNQTALLGFFNSHTLSQLKSGGSTVNTGFSGSLIDSAAVVPEPNAIALVLTTTPALGGFWFSRRRRKAAE